MSELVPVLRALIRDELRALRLGDLGVVTRASPHAEAGDLHNYECSVRLREGELELRRVPMCTPHLGMASAPRVGDLVLVTYVNGDPQRPIILGRLHSDEARPPLHKEGDWHVESPYEGKTSITLGGDGEVLIRAGETRLNLKPDGNIEINVNESLKIQVKGDINLEGQGSATVKVSGEATVECASASVNASGSISLGQGGAGVITMMTHKCYFTGAPLIGSTTVTAKG